MNKKTILIIIGIIFTAIIVLSFIFLNLNNSELPSEPLSKCGDGICEKGETVVSCPGDCTSSKRFGIDAALLHSQINFPEILEELGDGISGANAICYFENNPAKTKENLGTLDELYKSYKRGGRTLQVNLLSCTEEMHGGAPTTQLPSDINAYKNWIRYIVNRYKGDIFYYQIDSEPTNIAFLGTKEEFVTMLNTAYNAAKEIDPNVIIMSSGWTFGGLFVDDPNEQEIEQLLENLSLSKPYWYEVIAWVLDTSEYVLQNGKYDVVSIHQNRHYNSASGIIKWVRKYTDKPIIFEDMMSGPSPVGFGMSPSKYYPEYSAYYQILENPAHSEYENVKNIFEAEQARVTVKKSVASFAAGVDKVFISWAVDLPNFSIIMWKHQGLLGIENLNPPEIRRKPVFYTAQMMISKLDGFTKAEKFDDYTYKFSFTDKNPVYVSWSENGSKTIDISSHFDSNNVLVTYIVTEQGQTEPETKIIQTNSIPISKTPIFVEEQ